MCRGKLCGALVSLAAVFGTVAASAQATLVETHPPVTHEVVPQPAQIVVPPPQRSPEPVTSSPSTQPAPSSGASPSPDSDSQPNDTPLAQLDAQCSGSVSCLEGARSEVYTTLYEIESEIKQSGMTGDLAKRLAEASAARKAYDAAIQQAQEADALNRELDRAFGHPEPDAEQTWEGWNPIKEILGSLLPGGGAKPAQSSNDDAQQADGEDGASVLDVILDAIFPEDHGSGGGPIHDIEDPTYEAE